MDTADQEETVHRMETADQEQTAHHKETADQEETAHHTETADHAETVPQQALQEVHPEAHQEALLARTVHPRATGCLECTTRDTQEDKKSPRATPS